MKVHVIRRAAAPAVLALLALLPALAGTAPAPAAKPAAKPATAGSRLAAALPDTVLARVFTGTGTRESRDVTRGQLVAAAARGGRRPETLTPKERREFLDVLVDQAVLVARVQKEPRLWNHRDSADWNSLRDRLVLRAALDSAMVEVNFERAARGDSLLPPQAVGVYLRDRELERLGPTWNAEGLAKAVSVFDTLPRPDSRMSMLEQMRVAGVNPVVGEADGALKLADTPAGPYTLGELVGDFGRLNPMYRPRVASVENVKELVANVLFERALRAAAAARGLERRPDIARPLAERAEYLDVSGFVAREVYAKIALDSLTLRRHFAAHRSDFDFDERAQVVRMVFPDRAEAEAMVQRLTVPNEAESLAARSSRAGVPYATTLDRASDTLLFARMKRGGAGAVLGPDSTRQGWRALRVMQFEPKRPRTFEQAEPMVKQNWYEREGERLMRDLLDGLRRRAVVVLNEPALAKPLPASPARR